MLPIYQLPIVNFTNDKIPHEESPECEGAAVRCVRLSDVGEIVLRDFFMKERNPSTPPRQ